MSYDVTFKTDDFVLYSYPIREESSEQIGDIKETLNQFEALSYRLNTLHWAAEESFNCPIIERVQVLCRVIHSLQKLCDEHKKNIFSDSEENRIFLAIDPKNHVVQSIAHAYFNKKEDKVKIGHVLTAPWNISNSFPFDMPHPSIKGAGTEVTEYAIGLMHKLYPMNPIYLNTPPSAERFFSKKFGFKRVDKKTELTEMALSATRARMISKKMFKAFIK